MVTSPPPGPTIIGRSSLMFAKLSSVPLENSNFHFRFKLAGTWSELSDACANPTQSFVGTP